LSAAAGKGKNANLDPELKKSLDAGRPKAAGDLKKVDG